MKIFWPNRYVNASYEWPILEQFMGKCCPIVSCLERPLKLRNFFSMVKSLQTTQHKSNQHQPKNSCKPADFRQILQFTSKTACPFPNPPRGTREKKGLRDGHKTLLQTDSVFISYHTGIISVFALAEKRHYWMLNFLCLLICARSCAGCTVSGAGAINPPTQGLIAPEPLMPRTRPLELSNYSNDNNSTRAHQGFWLTVCQDIYTHTHTHSWYYTLWNKLAQINYN